MHNKETINTRPPIITVAGHIDHGKTTLLNYIRQIKNPEKEYGGITQHIHAYNIQTPYGNMTLIDTPGHFAFNSIRINSIQHTDIMLLVVSIDDGIKPQTIESIETAKKYNIPIIVAINKIDKHESENKKDKIINDLVKFNLIPETWGGDAFFSFISAKTGEGITSLLENIHIQSEMLNLKANLDVPGEGIILDNTIDNKKGTLTSLILLKGKLKKGDIIKTSTEYGKVKLITDGNKIIHTATPSMYIQVTGLQSNQKIGDHFIVAEKNAKKHISYEKNTPDIDIKKTNIEDLMKKLMSNDEKKINLIIKADVQGSIHALKDSITNLSTTNIKINIIKIGIGTINKSDIDLAVTTKSILIGFNIKANHQIIKLSKTNNIKINIFNVIYDVLDHINELVQKLLLQDQKETVIGTAEVKKIFNQDLKIVIAGCVIVQGKIKQNAIIKIFRKNNLVYKGSIQSIKVFKNTVHEVSTGTECGISIKDYNNIQINDKIKAYSNSQD